MPRGKAARQKDEHNKGKEKRPSKQERESWNKKLPRDIKVFEGGAPGLKQQKK